jgi:hypothetical protein
MSPCTLDEKSMRSNSPDGAERKERLQSERSSDEVKKGGDCQHEWEIGQRRTHAVIH